MNKSSLTYLIGAFVFATGIACSFLLARLADSSIAALEDQVYIKESGFFAERCLSLFATTSWAPGLVDALSLINVTNPEDFETLSDKLVSTEGISRVNLFRRYSSPDSASTEISEIYNTPCLL